MLGSAMSVTATAHRWGKRIGKTPIIVNDAPGFFVNRILGPYMNEAALLVEEGVPMEEVDAAMVKWGFPVGPITLFDEVGLQGGRDFVHRLERLVDGPISSAFVNHGAQYLARPALRPSARHLSPR